jgi:SAM-dependent methyltransferase
MKADTFYQGEAGEAYFARQSASGLLGAQWNRHFFAGLMPPTGDVLDFGCGGGFLLRVLPGTRKVGVEINPTARAVAERNGLTVVDRLDHVDGTFDTIVSSHALEHVENPCEVLRQLAGKLRGPESRLVLLLRIDDWRSPNNATYRTDDPDQHLYTWTPQLIGNLMRVSGLRVLESRVVFHVWPRGAARLWRLSPPVFHAAAWLQSRVRGPRQLLAVGALPPA